MKHARLIGLLGALLLLAGALLLWVQPMPAGRNTEELGASLFVLGALVTLLALLAWDVMSPYGERDRHHLRSGDDRPTP